MQDRFGESASCDEGVQHPGNRNSQCSVISPETGGVSARACPPNAAPYLGLRCVLPTNPRHTHELWVVLYAQVDAGRCHGASGATFQVDLRKQQELVRRHKEDKAGSKRAAVELEGEMWWYGWRSAGGPAQRVRPARKTHDQRRWPSSCLPERQTAAFDDPLGGRPGAGTPSCAPSAAVGRGWAGIAVQA
jgi:hypothetical protein